MGGGAADLDDTGDQEHGEHEAATRLLEDLHALRRRPKAPDHPHPLLSRSSRSSTCTGCSSPRRSRHPSPRRSHRSHWTRGLRPNRRRRLPSYRRHARRTSRHPRNRPCRKHPGSSRRCGCRRRTARALHHPGPRRRRSGSSSSTACNRRTVGAARDTADTAPPAAGPTPSAHPPGPHPQARLRRK